MFSSIAKPKCTNARILWVPPLSSPNCHLHETRQLTPSTLPPHHSAHVRHWQKSPGALESHPYSASRSSLSCLSYCTKRPATISLATPPELFLTILVEKAGERGNGRSRGENIFRGTACGRVRRRTLDKDKGCDIGYALATSSCEEANSVEHAPSQPFDAITAFAVPNPNFSSQSRRFFQVWLPSRLPCRADHPIYFGLANFI